MKYFYNIILLISSVLLSKMSFAQGDDCSSALTLTNVTSYCSNSAIYTNAGSTASGFAVASCWGATATEDVWFSFTAIGTDVLVSVNGVGFGGTINRPRIAIYSGSCSGTLTQLACANGIAGSGFNQVYRAGLVLGQTYFIRISSTTANEGTFELCVNNYNPPASASADCSGAGKLCNQNPISVGTLSGGGTNANEPNGDAGSCMVGDFFADAETNSVWYTWTCGTSGTLLFDLTPLDPANDLDYVLYQLSGTNPCGARTIIRCNTSSCLNATGSSGLSMSDTDTSEDPDCDAGENAYCQFVNMTAGTSYALLINNADGNSGFNITWGGTGTFLGPDPNIVVSDTTVCAGSTITFDGSTSTNYNSLTWTFNSTGSPVTATGVGPHNINFPNTGNYVAILQANSALGCSSVEYKNITVANGPTITVASAFICAGTSTVLTASGATSYTWSTGATTASISVSPTVATVYTVSSNSGSCVSSKTVAVSINSAPSGLSAGIDKTLTCASTSVSLSGSIATPTNATYVWTGANVCGTTTSITTSACAAGVYTLTATDPSNGCKATSTVQVSPSAGSPSVTNIPVTNTVTCTNTLVALSVSTTATPVTYIWSGPSIVGTNTTSAISVSQGGTYSYTVTDTNSNCTTTGSQVVSQNNTVPTTTAAVTGTVTCLTNTATIDANMTGMTYNWLAPTGGSVSSSTTQVANVTGAGIYSLTVTNPANGCTYTTTSTVSENTVRPTGLSAGTDQSLTCSVASVPLTGSISTPTNATYSWTGASVCGSSTLISTSACTAGVYTLTATDPSNGCMATSTVQVSPSAGSPSVTNIPVTNTITCTTTLVAVSVSTIATPVTYVWSGTGIVGTNTTSVISVSQGGTFSYTVTDTNSNCITVGTQSVSQNITIPTTIASSTGTVTCLTNTATIDANISGMTYSWTAPVGSSVTSATTQVTSVTGAGVYSLTVTDPNNGCIYNTTSTVADNMVAPSGVSAGTNQIITCTSNSVTLTGSVATPTNSSVLWTGASVCGTNTVLITQACSADTYTLTATDPTNGCVSTSTLLVTSSVASPTLTPIATTLTIDCNNVTQSVTVTSLPNTNVTYSWNNAPLSTSPNGSTATFNNGNTYVCTVTNTLNNCSTQMSVLVVNAIITPVVTGSNTQILTCTTNTALITTNVTPSASYSYTWTGSGVSGANTSSVVANSAGNYVVFVKDAVTGCTGTNTFVINSNTITPTVVTTNTMMSCSSNSVSLIAVSPNNVSYNWTTNNGVLLTNNNAVVTAGSSGAYIVTVTDNINGCTNTATATVSQTLVSVSFSANPVSGTAPLLVGFADQSGNVSSYSWNFGDDNNNTSTSNNPNHTFNTPGIYVVTLTGTDQSGMCTETSTITIEVFENTTLVIPNVFTPNGDGANDEFKIISTGMKDLNCDIFNRWGTKVYTISTVNGAWNGGGHNDGTYFFILKCTGSDGKEYKEQGYISLLK